MAEARDVPVLVPVHYRGEHGVRVGARADEQEDDEEEGLEVEEGRLRRVSFARGAVGGCGRRTMVAVEVFERGLLRYDVLSKSRERSGMGA